MDDKKYLDRDGLKDYDALIKEYVNEKIAEAIANLQHPQNNTLVIDADDPVDDEL